MAPGSATSRKLEVTKSTMLSPTGDNLINCNEGLKSQIRLEILNKLLFSNETWSY